MEEEKVEVIELVESHQDDPRQKLMWERYVKPASETFADAKNSAIAAGYSPSYANTITQRPWFKNKVRRMNLLPSAEKVLDKALNIKTTDRLGNEQADLLRVQTDVAKFVAKTQGKDEGYSERAEVTGKNGNPIVFMPVELMDKYNLEKGDESQLPPTE